MSTEVSAAVQNSKPETGALSLLPPWALIVVAIVSVQLGAAIAKDLFAVIGSGGVVFLRTFLGGLIMIVLMRPRVFGHSWQVYRMALIYGAAIAVNMLTFYATLARNIPLGVAVAIAFLGPLTISVINSRRAMDLVWVAMAIGGILLLSPITDANLDPLGVVLAFMTAAAWGIFILVTKRASRLLPGNSMLALGMCAAGLVSVPFGAVSAVQVLTRPDLMILALAVVLLSSVIPFWLEFSAFRKLSPRVFSLLMSLEPAVAAVMGWLILHEALSIEKVIGIGLVTLAAAATTRSGH